MPEPSLREILDFATEAAWHAGRITLQYFQTDVTVDTKADATPVTAADRGAEQAIRELIGERFPDDAIIGEEHGEEAGTTGRRWIIDPIDGTKSFVHGVPLYGVMIGVEIDGEPAVGVVNLPAMNEMVCAAKGLGCTWNGRPARTSTVTDFGEALICFTSSDSMETHGRGDAYRRLRAQARLARGWGDCYGHILVATGRAEIMLDPILNVWDCAALPPIIEEAGGTYTDWEGRRSIWAEEGISTNGTLFDEAMSLITG